MLAGGRQSVRTTVVAAYEQQRGAGSRARGGGGGGGRWGGDRQRGGRKEEESTSIWGDEWDVQAPAASPAASEERSGGSWRGGEERSGGGSWRGGEERSDGGSWRGGEKRSGGGSWRGGEERGGGGSWRGGEERGVGGSWRGGDRQRSDRRGGAGGDSWSRDRRPRGGERPPQRYGGDRFDGDRSERGERRERWQPRDQQAAGRGPGGYRPAYDSGAAEAEGGWGEEADGPFGAPDAAPGGLRQFWIGDVLYGVSPVLAALQAGRREVHTLYLQDGMDLSKRKVGAAYACA